MANNHDLAVRGWVELRGLQCPGRHGSPAADEPDTLFVADVAIEFDLGPVARSDVYADVVDLVELAASVRNVVGGPPRLLLETVVVHAARRILEDFPIVSRVRLRLAKPDPPGLDAAEEAVELTLDRRAD